LGRNRLTPSERELLGEVLTKRAPDWLLKLDSLGHTPLSDEDRNTLREILTDELVETGLRPDSEPNARGHALEDLIDRIGHLV
jgi:hypothetical protein